MMGLRVQSRGAVLSKNAEGYECSMAFFHRDGDWWARVTTTGSTRKAAREHRTVELYHALMVQIYKSCSAEWSERVERRLESRVRHATRITEVSDAAGRLTLLLAQMWSSQDDGG